MVLLKMQIFLREYFLTKMLLNSCKKGKRYPIILQNNKWQNLPASQFLTCHFTSKSSWLGNFNFSPPFQLLKCS